MSKIYYHVVTDKPMEVGQELIFDANHHSGVYNRVFSFKDKVDEIYNNPSMLASLSLFNYLPDELLIPYGEEQCKYMNLTPPATTLPRMEYIHELNKKGIV